MFSFVKVNFILPGASQGQGYMDDTTSACTYGYRVFAVSGYEVFCLSLFEDLLQEMLDTQAQ